MNTHSLQFHRDPHGAAHAASTGDAPNGRLLAQFFEGDLAHDTAYCGRLLAEGAALLQAKSGSWMTSGNAFSVHLDPQHVTLRPLYGEYENHPVALPAGEFLDLVQKWQALIEK
jgi:hypothetical protein